jgi:hypothetical protein
MNAIVQDRYGAPEQVLRLKDVDRPAVGGDDVLVRVRATSVNTPDWITVTGVPHILRLQSGVRRPRTPVRGTDAAGVVEAVGKNVTDLRPGDEVFGVVVDEGPRHVGHLRGVRRHSGGSDHQDARRPHVRRRRSICHVGNHRSARDARCGEGRTEHPGSHQRRVGRRWDVRGSDRPLARRGGNRCVQHEGTSSWSARSVQTTSSTTRRRTSRGASGVMPRTEARVNRRARRRRSRPARRFGLRRR